ncbi:ATP-dependent DNA helicase RecQ [Ramlibacter ginsenosidimutans]|uniref:ATP-dependent DNA helicase RecQ n=1 Tax=Ramlibacter ginsenosidimutans TaxID=502333 RepID=A0A934TSE0_9BURK|nr:RecQ family ATP-dependent DNA helicase [Ramlibacter ginsenosidimutans]MBK6006136.1 ATP-dependent DNA helicase RecQ [Ramlibacter ginsenosidimutans]
MPRTASPTAAMRRVRTLLRDTFGLSRLRPGQAAVIERVLAGQPTLAIMPTGAGKSLCYQLPALLLEGRTVVVSPLIALMKDQCESLRALGIAAVQVNSGTDGEEARAAEAAVADGSARIIMTTPERLSDPAFLELLTKHPVGLLAVDEAHCISQWGHDFRPAFLEIAHVLPRLGRPVVLALTATATERIAQDICQQLQIPADGVVNTSAYRPNLDLRVVSLAKEADKLAQVLKIVRAVQGSGIVYTATVKAAAAVHEALAAADESVGLYHGKLPAAERAAVQEAFMNGERRVMVATNAFGLGIDKPDIRFVLHYQLPATLEAYYQEAGRAGRDGETARCTLLFLRGDKAIQQFFMAGRYPGEEDAMAIVHALQEQPAEAPAWTLPLLQARIGRPRSKLQVTLGLLRKDRIVSMARDGTLRLLAKSAPASRLRALTEGYGRKRDLDREALERMVFYAQTGQCRWRVLLEHLEEDAAPFERCGHCDNCRRIAAHEAVVEDLLRRKEADAQENGDGEHEQAPAVFTRGDLVEVRRYGRGVVEEATATQVTVAFADRSRRSFLPEFVRRARAPRQQRAQDGAPA